MGTIHRFIAAAAAVAAVVASGCGGEEGDYANTPRPPTPITVGATILSDSLSVSPKSIGGGPVTLLVSNQTEKTQEITLETDEIGGDAPGIEQNTGPINPGDTAQIKADLRRGTYKVSVGDSGIGAVTLRVGPQRESAQDELLQP